jgi:hypothetical protein
LRYLTIIVLITSCAGNKYYDNLKPRGSLKTYYLIKKQRSDRLRLFVYTRGIPHYSYLKIYADKMGNVTKIIRERDGETFFEAITDYKNGKNYFNDNVVQSNDTFSENGLTYDIINDEIINSVHLQRIFQNKYCTDLKFPLIIGWVKIERPKDYIKGLDFIKFLRQR